jgi:hypothetical protein
MNDIEMLLLMTTPRVGSSHRLAHSVQTEQILGREQIGNCEDLAAPAKAIVDSPGRLCERIGRFWVWRISLVA